MTDTNNTGNGGKPKGTWGGARPGAGGKPRNPGRRKPGNGTAPTTPATPKPPLSVESMLAIAEMSRQSSRARALHPEANPFQLPQHPPGATPPKRLQMAFDNNISWASNQWAGGIFNSAGAQGLIFPGYPYLAELAQVAEYRMISETPAGDATRKWIAFQISGEENKRRSTIDDPAPDTDADQRARKLKDAGKSDKVKALNDEMSRLGVRDLFYAIARDDGFFGRSHLYLNFGEDTDGNPDELTKPIGDGRNALSQGKIDRGSLKRMKTIEPVWTYPTTYNAIDPFKEDWYNPQVWYVMGKQIHASRLLTFISRPVPDLLKPSYSFGGLSLSQLAQPYVDIWLQTRQSVARLIHSFSVMVLSTDLATLVQPGVAGASLLARVNMFNALRDNAATFVVNKETEDFKNVSVSLAGLEGLQAQSQEHLASISRIPLVKLLGISPTGLNATADSEIRVYYDTIADFQNRFFRPNLTKIINFIQLSLWGEIDPEITFEFEPLWELSAKELSEKQKDDAELHQKYVDLGAFSPAEVRKVVIDDPDLPFTGLEAGGPDLKQEEESGLIPEGAGKGVEAVLGEGDE